MFRSPLLAIVPLMIGLAAPMAQANPRPPSPPAPPSQGSPTPPSQGNPSPPSQGNPSAPTDSAVMEAFRKAMAKYEANDLAGALEGFNEVIRLDPNIPSAYINRGNIKDDMGDAQGALTDYSKAINLDPSSHNAFFNRGITYARLERYSEAIGDFQKSINLKSDYAPAYRGLGVAKYYSARSAADKRTAVADVQRAASLYRNQGQTAKAEETEQIATRLQSAIEP